MIRTGELNVDGSTNTTKFWFKPGFTRAPPPQPKGPRVVVTPTEDEFDIARTALHSKRPGVFGDQFTADCVRVRKALSVIAGNESTPRESAVLTTVYTRLVDEKAPEDVA